MTENICPICGGTRRAGSTTFTIDYKSGVLVVRNVPADVCSQCGEEWIADDIASKLQAVSEGARTEKRQVEVVDFGLVTT